MSNPKGGINRQSFDGDSEGDSARRYNAILEGNAGAAAGPNASEGRTLKERQASKDAIERKTLEG
jgi:hypothetical protein